MKAKCPVDSPDKCYNGVCFGRYEFCSDKSQTVEPCINKDFLTNNRTRETVCQAIAQGKNTGVTINPLCNMKTDCFKEFGETFYIFKQGNY